VISISPDRMVMLILAFLLNAAALLAQKQHTCQNGEVHIEINVENLALRYEAKTFETTLSGLVGLGGRISVSPKTLQEAAAATQQWNELLKGLAVGYNSCAISQEQYNDGLKRIYPRLREDATELEKMRQALLNGRQINFARFQKMLDSYFGNLQRFAQASNSNLIEAIRASQVVILGEQQKSFDKLNQNLEQLQLPIERTTKFSVMVPFNTAPNAFPIPIDENPDDPMFRTYGDIRSLAVNGTVPSQVRGIRSDEQISWHGKPISITEAPTFLGRLLQYYIFKSIDSLQRNTLTVAVGYPAEAQPGIEPPDAASYPNEKLFQELANNEFFQPFQFRESSDHMTWAFRPVVMPLGTEIKFIDESKPERYLVRLERTGYFRIEFVIENFSGTGVGSIPKNFVTAQVSTTMQWAFFVTMRYAIQRRTDHVFHPDTYAQWADAIYAGLHEKLAQR
jgi:hypothetical protein